jgi:hypothetical protein
MQKVLVDGSEFITQYTVEEFNDFGVTLHGLISAVSVALGPKKETFYKRNHFPAEMRIIGD